MLDRFISFLRNLPQPDARAAADDPRIAAAALLYHVMDADGVRDKDETAQLPALLEEIFGIAGPELKSLMRAAERAESEAVDLYAFTSVINRHYGSEVRRDLVGAMWELVFADGEMHELEDNVVWRVAELLHVEREDRVSLRQRAREVAGPAG